MSECETGYCRRELFQRAAGGFASIALAGILADRQADRAAGRDHRRRSAGPQAAAHSAASQASDLFVHDRRRLARRHVRPQAAAHSPITAKRSPSTTGRGRLGQFKRYLKAPQWTFRPRRRMRHRDQRSFSARARRRRRTVRHPLDGVESHESLRGDAGHAHRLVDVRPAQHRRLGQLRPGDREPQSAVVHRAGAARRRMPVRRPGAPIFCPAAIRGCKSFPVPRRFRTCDAASPPTELQRLELDLMAAANRRHRQARPDDAALDARIRSFETAFGMQRPPPKRSTSRKKPRLRSRSTASSAAPTTGFGWQCLVARRLVERGVRFVEVIDTGSSNNWDSHGDMRDHEHLARNVDRPIAGLLRDLKQRGLLDDTLVVWTTEFGRTPYHESAERQGPRASPPGVFVLDGRRRRQRRASCMARRTSTASRWPRIASTSTISTPRSCIFSG